MSGDIRSAFSAKADFQAAADELTKSFSGMSPKAIIFFCSHRHDGSKLSAAIRAKFPQTEVVGCTTAGEFTNSANGVDSVSALALGGSKIRAAAGGLAKFEGGVDAGVKRATQHMADQLKVDLRAVDPKRYIGIVLVEGLKGREEAANDALGNVAPQLSFVGGSAGDNLEFKETRVFYNGEATNDGAALLLLDSAVPFTITKTCSFEPTGKKFVVTRADVANRVVYELDGKPVAQVYAEAVGTTPAKLDGSVFMSNPLGLMIDGAPWIRSPQQVLPDGGLKFYCIINQGMEVHLMRSTDLVGDTKQAMARAQKELGKISGGLTFNCILRRLELDAKASHGPFLENFKGLETAGFHTYGESWLGHINQTLTAVLFS